MSEERLQARLTRRKSSGVDRDQGDQGQPGQFDRDHQDQQMVRHDRGDHPRQRKQQERNRFRGPRSRHSEMCQRETENEKDGHDDKRDPETRESIDLGFATLQRHEDRGQREYRNRGQSDPRQRIRTWSLTFTRRGSRDEIEGQHNECTDGGEIRRIHRRPPALTESGSVHTTSTPASGSAISSSGTSGTSDI